MKTVELFCASPASTAICTTTNHRAMKKHLIRRIRSPRKIGDFPASGKGSGELDDRNTNGGSSSRHLLDNAILVENLEDSDDVFSGGGMAVSGGRAWPDDDVDDLRVVRKCLSSRLSRGDDSPAVVELRVSIHCKGCEGKVKKHISRMEGVKSFHIDLESKKVTVIGDITPLSVLASISKVKNAQLWPSSPSSSSSPFIAIGF
ncbi:hypothetical protein SSX86_030440 [Deinandra increscens subsp. villosa]|uniref:HMA domain-containing protein n=1 Tax=Deinandra increscens subsp. villosa TaxID=3103831 RepID=A0AAP0CBK0_9ASTR